MAAKAADCGTAPDLIDIYDENFNQNNGEDGDFATTAEASDLYDAVLTGSVSHENKFSESATPLSKDQPMKEQSKSHYTYSGGRNKKLSVYVGNFSWWTSDIDLINVTRTLGVKDVLEIKFAENRANGQSRGYAELVVATEESVQRLLVTMPNVHINGEKVDCRFATRQNLAVFEAQANKRVPQRSNSKESADTGDKHTSAAPPVHNLNHSNVPNIIHPLLLQNKPPPLSTPFFSRPPPLFPHLPPHLPPSPMPHLFPPPLHLPSQPPPSLHLNPAFFPPVQHDNYNQQQITSYNQHNRESEAPIPPVQDGEFDELMNRNRAIASSAITKAVSGATAGDLPLAIETLLTASAVIKQSRVYGDERCRALVISLKDCLFSIESKAYGSRKRHRSRDREHRSRDRERERERERERDRVGREMEESGIVFGNEINIGSIVSGTARLSICSFMSKNRSRTFFCTKLLRSLG
ncbi:hypothetical protein DPEC_G00255400 [Dallia pectoralis]|uniref:Uncharacterized protein n=1 Tax=Dallia pectoralis TaxID=75939 RepID=A0ACC2FU89_DALPE|nr:hypothetical protein DPEC_G00255400 [Dallia pectoralis]